MCSKANADLVVCHLCSNEEVISEERRNASESERRQANRMRNLSERVDSPIFASQPNIALYGDLFIPE
jgi:hypothetical protein